MRSGLANLIQAYLLGLVAVDLVHDLPVEFNERTLAHGREYYCSLYDGLFRISGALRVHVPICLAAVLILRRAYFAYHEFPPDARSIYFGVVFLLGCPGIFLFGFCVHSVSSACNNSDVQPWEQILSRLAVSHLLIVLIFSVSIFGISKAESLAKPSIKKA